MELAAGGELFRRLSKKESFSVEASRFYSIEIFAALEYVQKLGYVYRDLKPENVMLGESFPLCFLHLAILTPYYNF